LDFLLCELKIHYSAECKIDIFLKFIGF